MKDENRGVLWHFYHWEKENASKVFLKQPFEGTYIDYTWKEAGQCVRKLAAYLKSLNLPPQSNIGLISKNCAEWIMADLAIIMAGHVSVPFYPTLSSLQVTELLDHSECKVLFFGKLEDISGIQTAIPKEIECISFPRYNPDPQHMQWLEIMDHWSPIEEDILPDIDQVYTIIYTSGTTRNPKGVMFNHRAVMAALPMVHEGLKWDTPNPRFFSYLPLAHAGERCAVEGACITVGGVMYFAESLDTFRQNLTDASPTHFLGVPRIWSNFQRGILQTIPQKKLDFILKIPIAKNWLKNKIKRSLGLENAVLLLIGASPVPESLIKWFHRLGIELTTIYGMTENLGVATIMPPNRRKVGTVGKPWEGLEIKIVPGSEEIHTRSAWNMIGYFNEPEMTAETIDSQGWLHTGDVGEIDKEGFLKIKGRIKEMYKTSKGEYVAPARIELLFDEKEYIQHICLIGEGLPQPIALIVLETSDVNSKIEQDLLSFLESVNSRLKPYEKIRKLVILDEEWTVENNRITPTLKLKRNTIEEDYTSRAKQWFEMEGILIWAKH